MTKRMVFLLAGLMGMAAAARAGQEEAAPAPVSSAATPSAPASSGPAAMLRFSSGELLWGHIEGHTPEQLVFRRLDTGGVVRVPWDLLDPAQADELRTRFGYVDLSEEEVMIDADRLLVGGGEIVGKIVDRTPNEIVVKTANSLVRVPKLRIQGAATVVRVPALDVYTADELYAAESLRIDPKTAADHVELAQFCERILSFDRALEHYQAASQLPDAATLDVNLEAAMAAAQEKAEAQAELEHLHAIDSLRARKKYDQALAECDRFEALFPDSKLFPEVHERRQRVERARQESLTEEVVRSWHRWVEKVARQAARTMSYNEVMAYVGGKMSEDIQAHVLADVRKKVGPSVEPDEVLNAWVHRPPGRWHKSSYGYGTWLLGEGPAWEGLKDEDEDKQADTSLLSDDEQALRDKIKRYLENQKKVQAAKARGGDEEEEREGFWKIFSLNAKELWITAYYAEHSGDMELRKPTARNCRDCGGTGVREVIYTGGGTSAQNQDGKRGPRSQKIACPTCHHVGIVRRVTYR